MPNDEMLSKMWKSNEDFHQRFLGQVASNLQALAAYREECKELENACIDGETDWAIACEAGDALYTIIGVLRSVHIDLELFLDAMQHVVSKNDAKTHDTHYIREDGKIAKRT